MEKESFLVSRRKPIGVGQAPDDKDSPKSEKSNDTGLSSFLPPGLICFRILNIFLVRTSFVPDEYWQSLEVAHRTVFGYGYLTWEWSYGLRSYLYPASFSMVYSILDMLQLDTAKAVIYAPRIVQACLSAVADWHLFLFAKEHFGLTVAKFTLFSCACNWFWWYCATRTIINTLETIALCIGLHYYPWKIDIKDDLQMMKFQVVAITMTVIRPTAGVLWIPLALWHLFRSRFFKAVTTYIVSSLIIYSLSLFVDRIFYGKWVITHWNFLNFNILKGLGDHYGTHPWHWYFTQGIPSVLGLQLVFFVLATCTYSKSLNHSQIDVCKWLLTLFFLTSTMFSFVSHKEFRFVLHLVPITSIFCGIVISRLQNTYQNLAVVILLLTNVPVALYTGLIHQGGTLRIMDQVRSHLEMSCKPDCPASVLFLTPCHATPLYSHMHINVTARFLECPPNLEEISNYSDESDRFYANAKSWLDENIFMGKTSPNYYKYHWIVMFDSLYRHLMYYTPLQNYEICGRAFHTHFPEGRTSKSLYLLCIK